MGRKQYNAVYLAGALYAAFQELAGTSIELKTKDFEQMMGKNFTESERYYYMKS